MKPLRLAWLGLIRHRVTTVLALASLGLTIGCAGILFRLGQVADSRFGGMVRAGDAIVGAKSGRVEILLGALNLEGPYPEFIPGVLYQTMHRLEQGAAMDWDTKGRFLQLVVPFVYCGRYKNYRLIGTDSGFLRQSPPGPAVTVEQGEWVSGPSEVVLGAEVARRENLKPGDPVLISPWTSADSPNPSPIPEFVRVSGVLKAMHNSWDKGLFTDLGETQHIFESAPFPVTTVWGKDVLHYFIVYLRPGGMQGLKVLIDQKTVAQVAPVEETRRELENLTGTGRAMGWMGMISLVLLGGLSMAGLLFARFEAKTRQLAVLRALGFQGKELRSLLLWEGILLGLGACFIGAVLDFALFPGLRSLLGSSLPVPQDVPSHAWQSWPVWIAAVLAAILFSVIPLILFNRVSPRQRLQGLS